MLVQPVIFDLPRSLNTQNTQNEIIRFCAFCAFLWLRSGLGVVAGAVADIELLFLQLGIDDLD